MLDHIIITVEDYVKSREFYEKALAPLGYQVSMEFNEGCGFSVLEKPDFWIRKGEKVTPRIHVAFTSRDREAVDAFYAAVEVRENAALAGKALIVGHRGRQRRGARLLGERRELRPQADRPGRRQPGSPRPGGRRGGGTPGSCAPRHSHSRQCRSVLQNCARIHLRPG